MIPHEAFRNCRRLEEVELSEGLLEIGVEAFHDCIGLKRITIPSTVTIMGIHAFMWCDKLEEVELCEGLQTIGKVHSIIAEL